MLKIEKWGLLNFKRKIKNYTKGYYLHFKLEGEPSTLEEIKSKTKLDNNIVRFLTVKYKKLDLKTEYFTKNKTNEKKKKIILKTRNSLNKLSLFQKSDSRFSRKCPFSVKKAPIIDYKNITLLQKYITETNKIITSKISNVSLGKQKNWREK